MMRPLVSGVITTASSVSGASGRCGDPCLRGDYNQQAKGRCPVEMWRPLFEGRLRQFSKWTNASTGSEIVSRRRLKAVYNRRNSAIVSRSIAASTLPRIAAICR
jgi:hypothetical protein